MRFVSVAGRYSRALLNLGIERGKEDFYEELLKASVKIYSSLKDFFDDPTVSSTKKCRVMIDTLRESGYEIDDVFENFISILFEKKRQRYLPMMLALFSDMKVEARGMIPVDVYSPYDLRDDELREIREFVRRHTLREPSFRFHLDESLIAGVRLEFEGMTYDISILGRLNRMYREVFGKG